MITCHQCKTENHDDAQFCSRCGVALQRPLGTAPLPANTLLQNRYRIIKMVGQGGMATVYQAEDLRFPGKVWAVKEMREDLLPATDRLPALEAFTREARLLACLHHDNLPRVIDHFTESGRHYLVMEYLEGQTLQERIEKRYNRPFEEKEVIAWALQICDALTYLHSQNPPIIYRDLKPGNIIVDRDGRVKLIDFGIARYFDPSKKTDTLKMGTTGYAPPEQYQGGGSTDARSDIYALGATMHHLLTGRDPQNEPPFSFGQARPRKLNPRLSEGVEAIIMKAVAYDPAERFQSAAEMREALLNPARHVKGETSVLPAPGLSPEPDVTSKYTHEIVPLPQADDLFQVALKEIEEQMAPLRMEEAAAEEKEREQLEALYQKGEQAIRQREWLQALEVLDAVRSQDGSFADVRRLALQAETAWLQTVFPETIHPPAPTYAARDWASISGTANLYADRTAERYVPPRHYFTLREKLRRCRMLVLVGPPGMGKFSTAVALAREVNEDHEYRPPLLLRPDTSPKAISGVEGRTLIWPYPFGIGDFGPPPLADRPDVLERLIERNYLILTTTMPLREMALSLTALGYWPTVAEATAMLNRDDYSPEDVAEMLNRHAELAQRQGIITPRQRDLLADPERRLELAPLFHSPLAVRLFVEHKLPMLDPSITWSTRDLGLVVAETAEMRQTLTRWFASLEPPARLFLTVLTWLAERPQAEIWETYAALTRHLQTLWPNLPIASTGLLMHQAAFCVSGRDYPRFKHPAYHELVREIAAETGREYTLQCLNEIEQAILAADESRQDDVLLNASLLLGELAASRWECITPSFKRLAASRSVRVKWAVGRGLARAAQKRPMLLSSEVSLLQQWAGSPEPELRLAALEAARHLGRIALTDMIPILKQLARDPHPAVRTGLVDVAVELAPAGWKEALELLCCLGDDAEESIREAVADRLIRLARWRRRAVLDTLLDWAAGAQSLLNGTIMRVLLNGRALFSVGEVVPGYRLLLSRQDDAGEVLVAYLSDPQRDSAWPLSALTQIMRAPEPEICREIDHILHELAWRHPQIAVQFLTDWARNEQRTVRETALRLMSSVGKAQTQERDPITGLNVLGGVYGERWFGALADLAKDRVPAIRAQLVHLVPDFAQMDALRTLEILAILAQDEHERIRQLTALALAPFAARYANQVVPILENLVGDASPRVREATIPAIADGVAQSAVVPAVGLLATLVRDPAVTNAATPAFISVASTRVDGAAVALAALSKDTNAALRSALLEVALKTGSTHPVITATFLAPLTTDHSTALRERLIEACLLIAQRDPVAPLDVLAQLALDRHPTIRERAVTELTTAGLKSPRQGLETLRRLAQERRSEVKLLALQALQSFAADHAKATLEATDLLLRDPDMTVRRATVPVIAAAGAREPVGALERLGRLLLDLDGGVLDAARRSFSNLCATKDVRLLPVLSRLATDNVPTLYLPALEGLANYIGTWPDAVLEPLTKVVQGSIQEARDAALSLLEQLAAVRLTSVVRALEPLLEADENGRRLYWRIMRLPEGAPIVTDANIVRSMAQNARWDTKAACKALSFGEAAIFICRRIAAKLAGKVK